MKKQIKILESLFLAAKTGKKFKQSLKGNAECREGKDEGSLKRAYIKLYEKQKGEAHLTTKDVKL